LLGGKLFSGDTLPTIVLDGIVVSGSCLACPTSTTVAKSDQRASGDPNGTYSGFTLISCSDSASGGTGVVTYQKQVTSSRPADGVRYTSTTQVCTTGLSVTDTFEITIEVGTTSSAAPTTRQLHIEVKSYDAGAGLNSAIVHFFGARVALCDTPWPLVIDNQLVYDCTSPDLSSAIFPGFGQGGTATITFA
jgi:hypothetical protein